MNKKGFTLLELLVAMGIFLLISMAASWILIYSFRYSRVIWEQLSTQSEGRKVVQQVVDEVRRAEQSSIGAYPIELAENNQFVFYANIDSDSLRERVRFWLDGTILKKGVIKPSGNPLKYLSANEKVVELAHAVVNIAKNQPTFLYYGENYIGAGAAMTQPVTVSDIRMLKIQLELEEDPNETPVPLHVEASVQIRNLKTN